MSKMEGCVTRTMSPQLPNTFLPTDIPYVKVDILVPEVLYVETYMEHEFDPVVCRCGLTICRYGHDYFP